MTKTLDQMQRDLEMTIDELHEKNINVLEFFRIQQTLLDQRQEHNLWDVIPDLREDMYN